MSEDEAVNCSAFDAEAVLLALGPQLEWRLSECGKYETSINPAGCYTVKMKRRWFSRRVRAGYVGGPPYEAYKEENTQICPRRYKHYSDAKAACERHHATGKWE